MLTHLFRRKRPFPAPRNVLHLAACVGFAVAAASLLADAGPAAAHRLESGLVVLGGAAPLVFVAVFSIAVMLLLPVLPFVCLGATAFGPWGGSVVNLAGVAIGGCLAYAAGRGLPEPIVRRIMPAALGRRVEGILDSDPVRSVFLLRVLPLFPYSGTSFALGLTGVRFRAFLGGTLLGSAPLTLAYTWLFARVGVVVRRDSFSPGDLLSVPTLLPLGLALALSVAARMSRARSQKDPPVE